MISNFVQQAVLFTAFSFQLVSPATPPGVCQGQTSRVTPKGVGTSTTAQTSNVAELYDAAEATLQADNYQAAADLLKRVLDLDPKHPRAWNRLGEVRLVQHKYEEAIPAFQKHIELNPKDQYAYFNLGRAYVMLKKYDEAIAAFRKQIEINPLDARSLVQLGNWLSEQKRYDEALEILQKAIALIGEQSPFFPTLTLHLGRAYLSRGEVDKAVEAFEPGLYRWRNSPTRWNEFAYELATRASHLDRAEFWALRAVEFTEDALRNPAPAQTDETSLMLVGWLSDFWDTLGWVYFQQGKPEAAESLIRASWLLAETGECADHLGQLYEKRGEPDLAARAYAQALAARVPARDSRKRLAALVGDEKIEGMVKQAGADLTEGRTILLGKVFGGAADVQADFLVEFESASGNIAKPNAVRFLAGEGRLRTLSDKLAAAAYPIVFPEGRTTRLLLRGVVSCRAATGECTFALATPGGVFNPLRFEAVTINK